MLTTQQPTPPPPHLENVTDFVYGKNFWFANRKLLQFHTAYNEADAKDNVATLLEMAQNSPDWHELPEELQNYLTDFCKDLQKVVVVLAHTPHWKHK